MTREELARYLDTLLEPAKFDDYLPNGLQVEGASEVHKIAFAVSASLRAVQEAVAAGADTLIVHHGWFWKNEERTILGIRKARIEAAIKANLNLFAFHLPLDAHLEIGNNAIFGHALGFENAKPSPDNPFLWLADVPAIEVKDLKARLTNVLKREPVVLGHGEQTITRVAWCTGAAQGELEEASRAGAQAYMTGEVSERTTYEARELGMTFLSCGHYATETFGIRALEDKIRREFQVETVFLEEENPI